MEMHKRVASVTPVPLGDETVGAQLLGDTVILVANSGDFYEDGGHVLIDGTVYSYSAIEEGEDDDTPAPSITLDSGLVGAVAAETPVEVWDPAANAGAGGVVTDWIVEVTDDTDGSPGTAYLDHALIPFLPDGLSLGAGASVKVTVDELGDWNVTNVSGKTPYIQGSLSTDADDRARVEVGEGMSFGHPAQEVRFYTGNADEDAPAAITSFAFNNGTDEVGYLQIKPPALADEVGANVPELSLVSGAGVSQGQVQVAAEAIILAALVGIDVSGGLTVSVGDLVVTIGVINGTMGAGSVGTGTFRDSVDARVTTVGAPITGTNANFNAIGNTRNTTGKYAGRPGWNTSVNKPIWATGATAASIWVYADGTTAHTPV